MLGDVTAPVPVEVRRIGKQVYLRGRVARPSAWANGTTSLATLPAGFAPSGVATAISVFNTDQAPVYARVAGSTLQLGTVNATSVGQPILSGSWPIG